MTTLQAFWQEFSTVLFGSMVGVGLAWSLRPKHQRSPAPFFDQKALPKLLDCSEDERSRLLREADLLALGRWRRLLQALPFAFTLAFGVGLARVLPAFTPVPDSAWVRAGIAGLSGGTGGWLTVRLTTALMLPHLRRLLDSAQRT